jgi:hypothetical protein
MTTGGEMEGKQRRGRCSADESGKTVYYLADPNIDYVLLDNDTLFTNHCHKSLENQCCLSAFPAKPFLYRIFYATRIINLCL